METTEAPMTYAECMKSKHREGQSCTDLEWYVVCVAQICTNYEGLDSGAFEFSITPPNPEIARCFDRQIGPVEAAIELFSRRH